MHSYIYLYFKKESLQNDSVYSEQDANILCFLFNLQQYEKIPFQAPLKKMTAKALMSLLASSSSAQSYACKGKDYVTDL